MVIYTEKCVLLAATQTLGIRIFRSIQWIFFDFDRYEKVLETEIDLTFPTANTSTLSTAVMLR